MIITAKFASTCPVCHRVIAIGTKVEWSKGAKACCPGCVGRAPAMQAVTLGSISPRQILAAVGPRVTPKPRRTGCYCGSVESEVRASDCRQCKHDGE